MVKRLCKIGNSTGVIIDKPLLDLLGLRADSPVEMSVEAGALVVKPLRRRRPQK